MHLQEYHVDLRCWLALASGVLERLSARFADSETATKKWRAEHAALADYARLKRLHWSEVN